MRKIIICLIALVCCGCNGIETNTEISTIAPDVKYYKNDISSTIYTVDIEGHKYIVIKAAYGVGIIHAEHCPCKTKQE